MLTTSLPLPLLLLAAASSFAQNLTPLQGHGQGPTSLGDDVCSLQAATITCACRPGRQELSLTASSMAGGGGAEVLEVRDCSSVTLAFPPLQRLHTLRVQHCGSATFQEKASPLLRHLVISNVSQLALQGPIFQGAALETVLLDAVRGSTLPSWAFAYLNKIQNVTFRDVDFSAVKEGAIQLQMVTNSELTLLRTKLLGVDKSGIVVRGVANFTMRESQLTTVGENGLQLDAAGSVSISDSELQSVGPVKFSVAPGAPFRFVDNVWRNSSLLDVAQQFLLSGVNPTVTGNTFHCACSPTLKSLVSVPQIAPLLESNRCDEGLCGSAPVPMSVLGSCGSQAELQAACKAALPPAPGEAVTPAGAGAGATAATRAAKPLSPGSNSTASAIAFSVTTALLLAVPAAAARAL